MRPVGFEVGKKYPTVLHIHGGPKMAFGDVFVHEMQCWTANGFAVLFCNPRGSDGRGDEFSDIRGKYGTIDYDDLMSFVDWAEENLPFVDKSRLGVTGGSYGGFMTNWIVGHTNRFRAAVTQRGICNWVSMTGMSDIGYYFVPDQQAADIWSEADVEELWRRSPLKYAGNVRTPTLVIHSDEDHRCEVSQGLQMFSALKRQGVDSKICVFKGENHELSRGGRPRPRLARLLEILAWFKERL
jgi:dipeptidyl aminopeptidase/acylaminoacyl peptidase